MNILFIAPQFYPHIGGAEKYILRVSQELIKNGHGVTVIVPKSSNEYSNFEILDDIKIHRFDIKFNNFFCNLVSIWFMLFKLKTIKTSDVVHCFDIKTFFWYFPFRFIYYSKPCYMTFFGHEGIFPIPKKYILIRKLFEKLTWGNICDGEYIKKWYGTKPNYVTHAAIDMPVTQSNKKPNENGATFVGQLRHDTGILEYLHTLKILRDVYGLDMHLDICGDGVLVEKIKDTINKYNLDVSLHGFIDNSNVGEYFELNKYAFVSGCNSNLEAMAYKRLVCSIYSNELKKDYLFSRSNAQGMSIIAGSPEELAENIAKVHSNNDYYQCKIETAYEYVITQKWEEVADLYLKLYAPAVKL